MPDYKEMYKLLFNETLKAILLLQEAQCKVEEMFLSDDAKSRLILIKQDDD